MNRRRILPGSGAISLSAVALALTALAILNWWSPPSVSANPVCSIDLAWPGGTVVQVEPGSSYSFPFAANVTTQSVREVAVQIVPGSAPGIAVSAQPEFSTISDLPAGVVQTNTVSGSLTVTVPEAAASGSYSVQGIGAFASCSTTDAQNNPITMGGRSVGHVLTVRVVRPDPTPTPQPEPTPSPTPPPPPAVCEPGFSLIGATTLEALAGDSVTVDFEASVVVRRVSQVQLEVATTYQGVIQVSFNPPTGSFSFDPLPPDSVLRTFSGSVTIDVPEGQPAGTYNINGLFARATCQGVDVMGSPTTFRAESPADSVTIRLQAATPTAEPTATSTATATATATATSTSTATATATATATTPPSATVTTTPTPRPSPIPRGTATPTATPDSDSTATSTATDAGTPVVSPTATEPPTATPRSIVRPPVTTSPQVASPTPEDEPAAATDTVVAGVSTDNTPEPTTDTSGATRLVWEESRALYAEESTDRSWGKPVAGVFAALLVAAGTAGTYRSRFRAGG